MHPLKMETPVQQPGPAFLVHLQMHLCCSTAVPRVEKFIGDAASLSTSPPTYGTYAAESALLLPLCSGVFDIDSRKSGRSQRGLAETKAQGDQARLES
jgi:hypothetical protein